MSLLELFYRPNPEPKTRYTAGVVRYFTLWMMAIGIIGSTLCLIIINLLGGFPEPDIKKIELTVPKSMKVEAIFHDGAAETHRETF